MLTQQDIEFYRDGYNMYKELYRDTLIALTNARKKIEELQYLLNQSEEELMNFDNINPNGGH